MIRTRHGRTARQAGLVASLALVVLTTCLPLAEQAGTPLAEQAGTPLAEQAGSPLAEQAGTPLAAAGVQARPSGRAAASAEGEDLGPATRPAERADVDPAGAVRDGQSAALSLPPLPAAGTVDALREPDRDRPAAPVEPEGTAGAGAPSVTGVPAAPLEVPELPPVAAQQPKIQLAGVPAAGTDPVIASQDVEGVAFAAGLRVGEVTVDGAEGPRAVEVAAIDPEAFRVLTPQVTADATAVWQRVIEGDAAFTHDAGRQLQVELGDRVPAADRTTLRIGAYASNGAPPVADAIVSEETAQELGLEGSERVLVALEEGAEAEAVAAALSAATGLEATVLADPVTREAFLTGASARDAFEPFTYIDNGDGMIQIDSGWVSRNIVRGRVPILNGEVVCHRLMIEQLRGALQEVQDAGLAHLIDPSQYGGCWVPRHIDFNPAKPLSMHGWGLAVDMNVSTNGLGQVPTIDMRIVEIFDRWGFAWGGRWRRPDGMHFELAAVLQR